MLSKKKIIKIIALVIVIGFVIYLISYGIRLGNYKKAVANISIPSIDLSTIPDGSYIGSYDVDFVAATVEVTVKDHTITKINLLKHHTDKGASAEVIVDHIVSAQSLDVDAITGATNSSLVIKKAIANALLSAQ